MSIDQCSAVFYPSRMAYLPQLVSLILLVAVESLQANVVLQGKRLVGRPDSDIKLSGENIEILERERCDAKISSRSQLDLPTSCHFLQGLYRYIYRKETQGSRFQKITFFAITKSGEKAYSLIVDDPVLVSEKEFPSKNTSN